MRCNYKLWGQMINLFIYVKVRFSVQGTMSFHKRGCINPDECFTVKVTVNVIRGRGIKKRGKILKY